MAKIFKLKVIKKMTNLAENCMIKWQSNTKKQVAYIIK